MKKNLIQLPLIFLIIFWHFNLAANVRLINEIEQKRIDFEYKLKRDLLSTFDVCSEILTNKTTVSERFLKHIDLQLRYKYLSPNENLTKSETLQFTKQCFDFISQEKVAEHANDFVQQDFIRQVPLSPEEKKLISETQFLEGNKLVQEISILKKDLMNIFRSAQASEKPISLINLRSQLENLINQSIFLFAVNQAKEKGKKEVEEKLECLPQTTLQTIPQPLFGEKLLEKIKERGHQFHPPQIPFDQIEIWQLYQSGNKDQAQRKEEEVLSAMKDLSDKKSDLLNISDKKRYLETRLTKGVNRNKVYKINLDSHLGSVVFKPTVSEHRDDIQEMLNEEVAFKIDRYLEILAVPVSTVINIKNPKKPLYWEFQHGFNSVEIDQSGAKIGSLQAFVPQKQPTTGTPQLIYQPNYLTRDSQGIDHPPLKVKFLDFLLMNCDRHGQNGFFVNKDNQFHFVAIDNGLILDKSVCDERIKMKQNYLVPIFNPRFCQLTEQIKFLKTLNQKKFTEFFKRSLTELEISNFLTRRKIILDACAK
jgi:hypothetical protein